MLHDYNDLIRIFDRLFMESEGTRLIAGDDEPLYLPRDQECPWDRVIFAHGFFASALHEISHWCIAGKARRRQEDYGYWYKPDGRDAQEQALFESVESRPQALEWLFSEACGRRFTLSFDNLEGEADDGRRFAPAVVREAHRYLEQGVPPRARRFIEALQAFYQRPDAIRPERLTLAQLGFGHEISEVNLNDQASRETATAE
ncbi:elongation factor P hydroxylase [Marinobacteraceae bacterium S3BR75-40.1]